MCSAPSDSSKSTPTPSVKEKTSPRPMGGVFSPSAQYPRVNYVDVFSSARPSPEVPPPSPAAEQAPKTTIVVRDKVQTLNTREHGYSSALLLVDMDSNARMDKKALREAGVKHVQVLTSGLLAARFLSMRKASGEALSPVDIIVCHPRLEDMSSIQWLDLIRLHPTLATIPVLGIVGGVEEAQLLGHMAGGFDDIIMRPYTQQDIYSALQMASEVYSPEHRSGVQANETEFTALLKQLEGYQREGAKAEMNFREGMRHVKEKSWDLAVQTLTRALYHKDVKGEAEYALAAAWQGKGNTKRHIYYLHEACMTFVRTQKWARARLAYTQLLRVAPMAENPFVRMAENHIRAQKYRDAAGALVLGLGLGNTDDLVTRMAKACLYTDNPPFTLTQLQKAFTAEELQGVIRALPAELERLMAEYKAHMQLRKEEQAALKHEAKTMPLQSSVLDFFRREEQQKKTSPTISYRGNEADVSDDIPGAPSLLQSGRDKKSSQAEKKKDSLRVLETLGEEDMSTGMFSSFPRLNDMATVVKVTWKLMKGR